ncbi:PQQ-dependent sugar dehydrogenase [Sphingomonas quercus]|uniref:PQQ-dependent sugar dehydrogenase n=1 Tax=Sphingomonas quercus TaxID=2842451 RepID=A0ABS6BK69_9SPHN|nr:PQQ-dependent sugar dehydrogenase [Sphingomonas quercus]MBU3078221.1 PQQ-dependent sugar dehydrogenase [Sphingomonas quercus]
MNRLALSTLSATAALALAVLAPGIAGSQGTQPAAAPRPGGFNPNRFAAETYDNVCAGCHGKDLAGGGRGPSLFDLRLLSQRTDQQLHDTIANGIQGAEMPAFKDSYDDTQIWQIIAYLRTHAEDLKGKPVFVPNPDNQLVRTEKQTFRTHVVTSGIETPWAMAFLPDGRKLVTERPGRLRIIDKAGKLLPDAVKGTPLVEANQDGGMLDVAIHPDYARNGWVYLSYTELKPGFVKPATPAVGPNGRPIFPPTMTVMVRGRINARNEWVDNQVIFRAPADLYTVRGEHYGSRFLFDGKGHVFFSIGERGDMTNAQRLDTPLGKIHRVNDDGSIPADNPFVNTPGAVKSIWSYGHRNPEGLAWDPATGLLWESEHGPTGGDEINIIEKGRNYGWGAISMGIQPGITKREAPGMEQPIVYYTPTIAPSGIGFYAGNHYPGWKNNLFVAGLAGQQLRRLEINGRQVTHQEVVFAQFGRTRAVYTGPDGLLYILLQNPTGGGTGISLSASTPGMVIRLDPVK